MLGNEFFPDRSKQMSADLESAMKDYYDFVTAYERLLFAPGLDSGDTGLQWISVTGQPLSGDAAADKIWFLTRHTGEFEVLHLLNLLGNDEQWRNISNRPPVLTNLSVKYRLGPDADISGVYFASPDLNHGIMRSLPYVTGRDGQGSFISFVAPSLVYWDMIYFERAVGSPADARYEAEDAVKYGVGVNTDHSGYSGAGFVDHFDNTGDSVSFVVTAAIEDDYSLEFRYANATGATATRQVIVDGDYVGGVSFPTLAGWATVPLVCRLKQGVHQVVLYFSNANGAAINLDYLRVATAAGLPPR